MIAFVLRTVGRQDASVYCLTDRKLPPVAVFTPSKVPSQGVSNIAHFIHKVVNSATFKPPWTGVKRKLTFYDLKCEFYRYCAPSNGNYRHKQLKPRDAKIPDFSPDPAPIFLGGSDHDLISLYIVTSLVSVTALQQSSHTPSIILMDQKYLCRVKDI